MAVIGNNKMNKYSDYAKEVVLNAGVFGSTNSRFSVHEVEELADALRLIADEFKRVEDILYPNGI